MAARALISYELRDQRMVSAGGAAWTVPVEIRLFRRQRRELPAAERLWEAVWAAG